MYQAVYGATAVGMFLFSSIKAFVYGWSTLRASSHLHDTVFYKVRSNFFHVVTSIIPCSRKKGTRLCLKWGDITQLVIGNHPLSSF